MKKYKTDLNLGLLACFALFLITSKPSQAHNNVVVVPMAGDDVIISETPDPTAPVTKDSPEETDYSIFDDVVIDNITQLEWQRPTSNIRRSWINALSYCNDLELDSKTDWRLPDVRELHSIVHYQEGVPYINQTVFPNTQFIAGHWTASTVAGDLERAWFVDFSNGSVRVSLQSFTAFVRCVR